MLLRLPGVSAGKINGLDAYFVNDKMFACISGKGVGLRLPTAVARELQFSRDNIEPFQPAVLPPQASGYRSTALTRGSTEKDLELFQASLAFVKAVAVVSSN